MFPFFSGICDDMRTNGIPFILKKIDFNWIKIHLKNTKNLLFLSKPGIPEIEGVTIIIPVYEEYDNLIKCINSILSSSTDIEYQLLIIDDSSTDKRIKPYLDYLKNTHNNIYVILNKKNLGYIKNINNGIRISKTDVILLHSDTVVTPHWVKGMVECAYSSGNIATVTPLSNNATFCSLPEIGKYDEIPGNLTTSEISQLIRTISNELQIDSVEIPTGIGFCLFVKRKIIDEIGLFNEIYGKGFDAESDFCMRAFHKGYSHACSVKSFVFHEGSSSFYQEQEIFEKRNIEILLHQYPEYSGYLSDFLLKNPLFPIQESIKTRMFTLKKDNHNKKIHVAIDCLPLNQKIWTGTHRYIFSFIEALHKLTGDIDFFVFTNQVKLIQDVNTKDTLQLRYARKYLDILLNSDDSEIFHRPCQCLTIIDFLPFLQQQKSVITILDLIAFNHPEYFLKKSDADEYRELMPLSIKIADKVIVISEHSKKELITTFNVPEEKIHVIYPGVDKKFSPVNDQSAINDFKEKYDLNNDYILMVGTDYPHKNIENAILAYLSFSKGSNYKPDLALVGPSISSKRRSEISQLIGGNPHVKIFDYVKDEDIVYFYNCAQVFLYPSLYEGFGLPILEAMACGIPVIASNSTSIPEVSGDAAILVDATKPSELVNALTNIFSDNARREDLIKKGFKNVKRFNWNDVAIKTVKIYQDLYTEQKNRENLDSSSIEIIKRHIAHLPKKEQLLINSILGPLLETPTLPQSSKKDPSARKI